MRWLPVMLALALAGCSVGPKTIEYGHDGCHYCKMTIVDRQHAAQVVNAKGKAFNFDAIECMMYYLGELADAPALVLITDYYLPGTLIDAKQSYYIISEAIPSPMGANLSGASELELLEALQAEKGGKLYDWKGLLAEFSGQ